MGAEMDPHPGAGLPGILWPKIKGCPVLPLFRFS